MGKQMKMTVLVYEYPPKIMGGLGTYAAEITKKFVLLGHNVSIFTMNDDVGGLPTRDMWRGIEIHRPLHIDVSDSFPEVVAEDVKKWGIGIRFFSKILKEKLDLVKMEGKEFFKNSIGTWLLRGRFNFIQGY